MGGLTADNSWRMLNLISNHLSEVGQATAKVIREEIDKGSESTFEFKGLVMKFVVDVIASCAFGIELNPDNDFYGIVKKATVLSVPVSVFIYFQF